MLVCYMHLRVLRMGRVVCHPSFRLPIAAGTAAACHSTTAGPTSAATAEAAATKSTTAITSTSSTSIEEHRPEQALHQTSHTARPAAFGADNRTSIACAEERPEQEHRSKKEQEENE